MGLTSSTGISATIITLNEERNLERAIESLSWVDEVLVVDSGSTDGTVEIAKKLGARVLHKDWEGYGQQKNFAQDNARFDWVLNIDADEVVTPKLAKEIQKRLQSPNGFQGFLFPRKTFYMNRWIRHGGWYPNHLVRLANRNYARWTEPAVHEALEVKGETEVLQAPLDHYTFRGVEDQVRANIRYAKYGAEDLLRRGIRPSFLNLVLKPIGKFLETYFIKRGFLDGIPGLIISLNAAHSMLMKFAFLYEKTRQKTKQEN